MTEHGYVVLQAPGHPRATHNGYVFEHILVAERALGRFLPEGHPVHHFDENGADNAPGNLVICQDQKYHKLLHLRARALAVCGNPNAHRCQLCQGYDRQDDITVVNTKSGFYRAYHRSCNAAAARDRRRAGRSA